MKKLLVASDIHIEWMSREQIEITCSQIRSNSCGVDVILLAGDICPTIKGGSIFDGFLQSLNDINIPVIMVMGNHDYWGGTLADGDKSLSERVAGLSNIHFLNNSSVVIQGQRFLGTSLWYSKNFGSHTDFSRIHDLRDQVEEVSQRDRNFLLQEVQPTDVVVTHFLPTFGSVPERYIGNPANDYYVQPILDSSELAPKLWVHGHTHESFDYIYGSNTRVVCNPFGYSGFNLNEDFCWKIVEI